MGSDAKRRPGSRPLNTSKSDSVAGFSASMRDSSVEPHRPVPTTNRGVRSFVPPIARDRMFAHYWDAVKPSDFPSTGPAAPVPDPADPRVMSGEIWSDLLAGLGRSRRIPPGAGGPAA